MPEFTKLIRFLGPTNPWSITVLMEPFSTSAFKVLTWIFATTTKICNKENWTLAQAICFLVIFMYAYSLGHLLMHTEMYTLLP